ncbi:MAG: hypothetical protein ABI647_25370, partial [Gemmatimonadota bacterium]
MGVGHDDAAIAQAGQEHALGEFNMRIAGPADIDERHRIDPVARHIPVERLGALHDRNARAVSRRRG